MQDATVGVQAATVWAAGCDRRCYRLQLCGDAGARAERLGSGVCPGVAGGPVAGAGLHASTNLLAALLTTASGRCTATCT